jgi:hypothetical protein
MPFFFQDRFEASTFKTCTSTFCVSLITQQSALAETGGSAREGDLLRASRQGVISERDCNGSTSMAGESICNLLCGETCGTDPTVRGDFERLPCRARTEMGIPAKKNIRILPNLKTTAIHKRGNAKIIKI